MFPKKGLKRRQLSRKLRYPQRSILHTRERGNPGNEVREVTVMTHDETVGVASRPRAFHFRFIARTWNA